MPADDPHGREAGVRTVGVDRLQPGDHAFLSYHDDETRWDILGVFTQQGFERGEKVGLLVDVDESPGWVASRVTGGPASAARALHSGQLVVSNAPRFARGGFDAARLVEGSRRRTDTACAEGFSGLRSASEMSLALAPVDHLGQAVEYERALHASLFGEQRPPRYTALCYWDERLFGGTDALDAARSAHSAVLLPRLGALHTTVCGDRLILTGDSDLANRTSFDRALRTLAGRAASTLVLDIADVSFFDAHSASAVLRLAAGLTPPRRLEVRCRGAQLRLLHLLGSRSVRQLSVITVRL
jgi:MEDS: MEthanogen/methylotroph, DcmR Sensory domain